MGQYAQCRDLQFETKPYTQPADDLKGTDEKLNFDELLYTLRLNKFEISN